MLRCKFTCYSVEKMLDSVWNPVTRQTERRFVWNAKMTAVIGGSKENEKFFASSPSGSFHVSSTNEDYFEPGRDYYFDIHEAPRS